jgi:hypothetical protein
METIKTDESCQASLTALRASGYFVSCVLAVMLAAAASAQAAVPKLGAWESGSHTYPRVAFEVRGSAGSRTVRRVSVPLTCEGIPIGWASDTRVARVHRGGRFRAQAFGSVLRGRFTATGRAEVSVHSSGRPGCGETQRYVVRQRGRRVAVRTGSFPSLVNGGGTVGFATDAFGRMVRVDYLEGSIPAGCSDGSQRPLTLAGPEHYLLTAPIRPNGRFDIAAAAGSSIKIAGTFDGGSVAAFVDLSVVLPDGTRCTAFTQPLVGALAFPETTSGQSESFPGAPVIIPPPQPGRP